MKGDGVMPAEKINYAEVASKSALPERVSWEPQSGAEDPGAWVPATATTELWQDPEITVRWGKDSFVQMDVECDVSYLEMVAKSPDSSPDHPLSRSTVHSPPLSRAELNKLIQVLRRARDAAYGRDQ